MEFSGKIPRQHRNMRVEFAWMCALQAEHYCYKSSTNLLNDYDLIVVILPKKNLNLWIDSGVMEILRQKCKKFSIMQEGPSWYFQDYDVSTQFWFYNQLATTDILFVHNPFDKKYYSGLTGHKNVHVLQSLLIDEELQKIPEPSHKTGTMIGGNFVSWYGGFDSYITALSANDKIYCPSMGRKQEQEVLIKDINYLPYLDWLGWMTELSNMRLGIDLMRTHAAGTFALNCAYFGIPCIGYKGLYTQETCFPELSVDFGDMEKSQKVVQELSDSNYYRFISSRAKELYRLNFSESVFLERFKNCLK